MRPQKSIVPLLLALALCIPSAVCLTQEEPNLTIEQQLEFLKTAKVTKAKTTQKGITAPSRLTLSDGTITHEAGFQTVNERKTTMQFADGHTEMNFVDSYLYNIAAYEVAKLVGLADMMPATVERKYGGKTGSLTWWLPVVMDEADRRAKKIEPPDPEAWNKQMYKLRVFGELVYDSDRNLTNVLITKDWKIYMIDFSRSFRQYHDLLGPKNLVKCDRNLLEKLKSLDEKELAARTKGYLTKPEVTGVMKRRDKIVQLFAKLVAEKGEAEVLY